MAGYRFNPPPGWPPAPAGWTPHDGWEPDPSWPSMPPGWPLWLPDSSVQPEPLGVRDGPLSAKGHNGRVTFDGQFVTLSRKGFFAQTRVGRGEKRIPIMQIVAVQWKSAGVLMGSIQFTISGGSEVRSKFGRQNHDANRDENSVTFYRYDQRPFEVLRAAIEAAIASPGAPSAAPDPLDELRKLGELRDARVLTQAEFEQQKALLLARRARI
jgi:hypothetical protein